MRRELLDPSEPLPPLVGLSIGVVGGLIGWGMIAGAVSLIL